MKIKTLFALLICVFYTSVFANQDAANGQRPMLPKEALEACKGKAQDDVCNFTGPRDMKLEGTCFKLPESTEMACVPKPPKVALDACSGKNVGDSCKFTGMNNDNIEGSCFKTLHGDVACKPAKMGNHPPAPEQGK